MSKDKIGIDDFILECWGVDSSGWMFEFYSDQWWEMKAESEDLGSFRAVSRGPLDVENTLVGLLDNIKATKARYDAGF